MAGSYSVKFLTDHKVQAAGGKAYKKGQIARFDNEASQMHFVRLGVAEIPRRGRPPTEPETREPADGGEDDGGDGDAGGNQDNPEGGQGG